MLLYVTLPDTVAGDISTPLEEYRRMKKNFVPDDGAYWDCANSKVSRTDVGFVKGSASITNFIVEAGFTPVSIYWVPVDSIYSTSVYPSGSLDGFASSNTTASPRYAFWIPAPPRCRAAIFCVPSFSMAYSLMRYRVVSLFVVRASYSSCVNAWMDCTEPDWIAPTSAALGVQVSGRAPTIDAV